MVDEGRHDPGRQAARRRMRLLTTVGGPEGVAPVVQRNIGVWLALGLIVVIVGLDLVGGGNAELLGLLVSPPILAASFVGPKRTVAVGVVALAIAVGYGRAVGVDLLAGAQGCRWSRSGSRRRCRGWWRRSGWSGRGGCGRSPGSLRSPGGRCWAACRQRWGVCAWPCCMPRPAPRRRSGGLL